MLRWERLEQRALLAANLQIVDAFLRDGTGTKITAPVLGEFLGVEVRYNSQDIPAGTQYRIDFKVDGVTLDSGLISSGAGLASGSWFRVRTGWYAEPGPHSVQVTLDAGGTISETNESDNTRSFSFTPVSGTPPAKFIWPIEGTLGRDYTIGNFVDLDPLAGFRDYRGGTVTYDGHDAMDIGPSLFAPMDAGLDIYAAADGVVTSVHDGEFDRHTAWLDPPAISNEVVIDHGGGWRTWYKHLRRDSVAVAVGDQVKAGGVIGLMGSSGNSTGNHLHFEVQHHGRMVETMFEPNVYWITPPLYTMDKPARLQSGVTNDFPSSHFAERPSDVGIFSQASGQEFRAWIKIAGFKQGQTLEFKAIRPNGTTHSTGTVTASANFDRAQFFFERNLPNTPDAGTWRIEYRIDATLIGSDSFQVTQTGAPEIRIQDSVGDLILDERFTPIDFGTVNQNSVAPTRTFTVVNHGSNTLQLGTITVPDGFELREGLPPSLASGQGDTFTIAMKTNQPGYFAGQVRVGSNDTSEADYNFSVEGWVTSTTAKQLTLGMAWRRIDEESQSVANVRLAAPATQAVTVQLSSSDTNEATVPASVIIPAGQSSAMFVVDAVNDFITDGSKPVKITAAATNFATAANSIDIVDGPPQLIVTIDATEMSESGGNATGTVRRANSSLTQSLTVTLTSDDTGEAAVPAAVSIPANQASTTFAVVARDDSLLDGTQTVTITAAAPAHVSGSQTINVTDYEPLTIDLALGTMSEKGGSITATVTRGATGLSQPLTINLAVNDTSEATVPTSAMIPFNQASTTFVVTAVDDTVLDGTQSVTVSASAAGYVTATKSLDVSDFETLDLAISGTSMSEFAGVLNGTVSRSNSDTGQPLTVNLSSSDTTEVEVPASVVIAANQQSATFQVNAVDDTISDGSQLVTINVSAADYFAESKTVEVTDYEPLHVTIDVGSIREDGGQAIATLTRSSNDISTPLEVNIGTSAANQVTVPFAVTIPAQQTSTTFEIAAVDDALLDGTQTVTIVATASGGFSGSGSIDVLDYETINLIVTSPIISEMNGTGTAIVTRSNTDTNQPLTVSISSRDTSEATVPQTVVIPANEAFVTFFVTSVDDSFLDGTQIVTIAASAPGYFSNEETINVVDSELLMVTIDTTSISEHAGSATATVTRSNSDISLPLTVSVTTSDTSELSVPAQVLIPANQASANFSITAVDDSLLDGTQSLTVVASASGYTSGESSFAVTDHETLTLTVQNYSLSEQGGATLATITRDNTNIDQSLTVSLLSSDVTEITLPHSVTIPANESSATFQVLASDDNLLDGTQNTQITASAVGYSSSTASMTTTDHETLTLTITAANISENGGVSIATVRRNNTDTTSPLQVNLSSNDSTEASVPASVTIAANQNSISFSVTGVDDPLFDGTQSISVTAAAAGYVPSSTDVHVLDHETLAVTIDATHVSENGGRATGTVTRNNTNLDQALDVFVSSSDTSEVTTPALVTIPASEMSSSFVITATDDTLLDGGQTATITVSSAGYESANKILNIDDHETLSVSLQATTISENGGRTIATITRNNSDVTQPLTVNLELSDPSEATTPPLVTIPAGESSVTVNLEAVDDKLLDATQTISFSASATGYLSASQTLEVTDHEILSFSGAAPTILETAAPMNVTVRRSNDDTELPLVVALTSSNTSEATVPASITIPAGSATAAFQITPINDGAVDGDQTVQITATAGSYESAVHNLQVVDNPFPWHNSVIRYDVTGDGVVAPLDALVVINDLNARSARKLTDSSGVTQYIDVTGDNFVAPGDVLAIINYLNSLTQGEGETPSDERPFVIFLDPDDEDDLLELLARDRQTGWLAEEH